MKKIVIILLVIFLLFNAATLMVGDPNPTQQEKEEFNPNDPGNDGYDTELTSCLKEAYFGVGSYVKVWGQRFICVKGEKYKCEITICL